ncbi:MAG: exodeoxyribonuclease V subunit beta, partial [Actinomycetota bacterium]|nr:exodeoxyribonuclease V subunit beta [Actinomycetota bacterium]
VVHPVSAGHPGRSLTGAEAPVQIRALMRGDGPSLPVGRAREIVTADVVHEVVDVLSSERMLTPRDEPVARRVQPGDIAVVVRTGAQLDLVHEALLAAGVPSVQRTTSSVFKTNAGADWVVLLEALEQPHRGARVRRVAITPFVGWDAEGLERNDLDELGLRVRRWLRVFTERGIAALLETISRDENVPSRLLAQLDGERRLTDLRHVGEALHAASMTAQLGLTATLEWLRRRVDESERDATVERSRRLDSDAAAVQVVTVHASKGLEFPVVFVPFGWDRHVREADIPLFHDAAGRRVRNVGGRAAGFLADQRRHNTEEFGEDLRLLYVALTRAQAQVTAWWAPSARSTVSSPLHRLMFSDDPATEVRETVPVPADDVGVMTALLARAVDGCLTIVDVKPRPGVRWHGADLSPEKLAAAVLGRSVDASWRRTSYSALTQGAHDPAPGVGSEPEVAEKDDETETQVPETSGDAGLRDVVSPMAALPGGTAFGTLVHAVLERVDPTSSDLAAELRMHTSAMLARFGPSGLAVDEVATALLPSLRTPLGPLAGGRALVDIAPGDRLEELDFELPLRGGDRPNGTTFLRELAQLLRVHLDPADPMARYAELLDNPVVGDAVLRGYLGGSIDAVLRIDGRYLVVDYKTNRLGPFDEPLTARDYRIESMAEAMLHAHYPLQALLYDVALHRFLRWRLPDYDPTRHLGGVLYLFLRGMCGPGVLAADGTVPGVFAWRPPASLVEAVSDAVAHGVRP